MSAQHDEDELIDAAKKLSVKGSLRLLDAIRERLSSQSETLRTASVNELKVKRHITELRGLGKELWQGEDAQQHVNAERDSWTR